MNDRARAIAILKQARDTLAERLTESVLEASEEIIEDAQGSSFMGEIEAVYEQMGSRLTHVSQMISNLPPIRDESPEENNPVQSPSDQVDSLESAVIQELNDSSADGASDQPPAVISQYVGLETPAIPGVVAPVAVPQPSPGSFQAFAKLMLSGDVEGAGDILAELFGIDTHRSAQCAQVFAQRMKEDPEFLPKAQRLRHELLADRHNGVIMLLYECFGLTGLESIGVLQSLRVHVARGL